MSSEQILKLQVFLLNGAGLYWARLAAEAAPIWRTIQFGAQGYAAGTSLPATISSLGAVGAGVIPVVAAAGVWMALGSGYAQAIEEVKSEATLSGFSHGFVMGILDWRWEHAVARFAKKSVLRKNEFIPRLDVDEPNAYNKGLQYGFPIGAKCPAETKKAYRITLRKLARRTDRGPWSSHVDEARQQQVTYVVELAAAARRAGIIKAN